MRILITGITGLIGADNWGQGLSKGSYLSDQEIERIATEIKNFFHKEKRKM